MCHYDEVFVLGTTILTSLLERISKEKIMVEDLQSRKLSSKCIHFLNVSMLIRQELPNLEDFDPQESSKYFESYSNLVQNVMLAQKKLNQLEDRLKLIDESLINDLDLPLLQKL